MSETSPIVSAVLPGGERSQFVMPPACFDGTFSITIRKPSFHVRTMEEYLADGFFDNVQPEQALSAEDRELIGMQQAYEAEKDPKRSGRLRYEFLQRAVVLGKNIIIAGETGCRALSSSDLSWPSSCSRLYSSTTLAMTLV